VYVGVAARYVEVVGVAEVGDVLNRSHKYLPSETHSLEHIPCTRTTSITPPATSRQEPFLHMILGHFFATNSATDCGTDNNYDQDCSDDEKRADFHSKNDSWGSVVVVDLADVC
jgi:hypothetical protein